MRRSFKEIRRIVKASYGEKEEGVKVSNGLGQMS